MCFERVYTAKRLEPPALLGAVFETYGTLWAHTHLAFGMGPCKMETMVYVHLSVFLETYFNVRFVFVIPFPPLSPGF